MHVVITGGAGFVGRRLAATLLERGNIAIDGEVRTLQSVKVVDKASLEHLPEDERLQMVTGSLEEPDIIERVVGPETDLVFHLAAVVSSAAEADFDLGLRVNFDATRALLESCRQQSEPPRFIFASSVAAYGGSVIHDVITDTTHLTPQTSYGAQKAAAELLVADYGRKGFIDGRSLRLPTVVIRPGKPNKAASTWASSIIREPLAGEPAICPVEPETQMYLASPRRIVEALLQAADVTEAQIGQEHSILLPGITVSVGEMLDALSDIAGAHVRSRVRFEPDTKIRAIVSGWPTRFRAERALRLGFGVDQSFAQIIQAHIDDELGGVVPDMA